MMRASRWLASFAVLLAALGCGPSRMEARPGDAGDAAPTEAPFGAYRSYFAVSQIGPMAHHFRVWFTDNEPAHSDVLAFDAEHMEVHDVGFGHRSAHGHVPPPPDEVAPLADAAKRAVRTKHPHARNVYISYYGHYRKLVLHEVIPTTWEKPSPGDPKKGERLLGWSSRMDLEANEDLTRVMTAGSGTVGSFGLLYDPPASAAQVPMTLAPNEDGQRLLLSKDVVCGKPFDPLLSSDERLRTLVEHALRVARDVADGKTVPTLEPLLRMKSDPSVPQAYDPVFTLNVNVRARPDKWVDGPTLVLSLPLHPRDVIVSSKPSAASAEGDIEGVHVRATATMREAKEISSRHDVLLGHVPGRDTELSVDLHVEDDRGNVLAKTIHAYGVLLVDRAAVGIPYDIQLESAYAEWPGHGTAKLFAVNVGDRLHASLFPSPVATIVPVPKNFPSRDEILQEAKVTISGPESVRARIESKMRACYLRTLKDEPQHAGKATIVASLARDGRVIAMDATAPNLDPRLVTCLRRVVGTTAFPPPHGSDERKVTFHATFTP